ncbi:MAG: 50S ribosomal protein L24 [Flavobacteriia bacterium]|nr:50S ribosomal protein L24 [Flavobacteriia bacterium]
MAKFHIKKGDNVQVIAGNAKGKTGRVIRMIPKQNRAVVEGLNMVKKHQKPSASNPQGGIVEMEAPIHISNLMLVDPKENVATRVGRKLDENGKLVRYAKKSGEVIK